MSDSKNDLSNNFFKDAFEGLFLPLMDRTVENGQEHIRQRTKGGKVFELILSAMHWRTVLSF